MIMHMTLHSKVDADRVNVLRIEEWKGLTSSEDYSDSSEQNLTTT